jgi:hypothetical protein
MKSLAEDNNKTVSEIETWLTSSTIDKINIKQGARLFNDYCWLVINNRIVIITQESRK